MGSKFRIVTHRNSAEEALIFYAKDKNAVVDIYHSSEELFSKLCHPLVTVLVADENLLHKDPAGFLERVSIHDPSVEVIMVEDRCPPIPKVVDALLSGFIDVLERPIQIPLLDKAIARACAKAELEKRVMRLSQRELDVLRLLADGLPNKHVANRLGISHRTVEVYRARIMDKMSVDSFAGLLSVVLRSRCALVDRSDHVLISGGRSNTHLRRSDSVAQEAILS